MTAADRLLSLNGDHLESICPELAAVVEAAERFTDEYAGGLLCDAVEDAYRACNVALAALAAKLGSE